MKKGITVSILVVTIILMFILVTTATVVGTRTIQTAMYEEFCSKLVRVSNDVNAYLMANDSLPTTLEIIAKEGLPAGLKDEINNNNDMENNLFVVDMMKIRTESVNIGKGSIADRDVFIVAENTNNVYYLKGIKYRNKTYYGMQALEITASSGTSIPQEWQENVSAIVDGVPIPKGFAASPYGSENGVEAENTKNGGLVIYELKDGEASIPKTESQFTSWTTRNQYVWVPVDKTKFATQFIKKDYMNTSRVIDELGKYYNLGTSGKYWELEVDYNNIPKIKEQTSDYITDGVLNYITDTTLLEAQAMYASVKEYGGFYIARYEAGLNSRRKALEDDSAYLPTGSDVYSMMNKIPYSFIPCTWDDIINEDVGGAIQVARSIYPNNDSNTTGVISTLTYGVQWDRTIDWCLETNAIESATVSTSYGNYIDHIINSNEELNDKSKVWMYDVSNSGFEPKDSDKIQYPKDNGESWMLTTGALKVAKVNNIYDMAGNMFEWTMELRNAGYHTIRGSHFAGDGESGPIAIRNFTPLASAALLKTSFRPCLYIKK